jgi:AcrR family transcriptional regulator
MDQDGRVSTPRATGAIVGALRGGAVAPATTGDPRRRQRILAAALAVFSEHGFREAEVQTIAERAGVGKATIYRYFGGKEDLFLTIVDEGLATMADIVLCALVGAGLPRDRLRAACRELLGYFEANRALIKVLIQEAGEFAGEIQRRYLVVVEKHLPLAEAFFQTLRADGGFPNLDTRRVVQLLMNLLVGTVYAWAVSGETSLVDEGEAYLDMLFDAWAAVARGESV